MATHKHARILSLLGWNLVEMLETHSRLKRNLNTAIVPRLCEAEHSGLKALCEELIGELTQRVMHALAKRLDLPVVHDRISPQALMGKFPLYKKIIYHLAKKVSVQFQDKYEALLEKTSNIMAKRKAELASTYDPEAFTNLTIFLTKIGSDPSATALLAGLRKTIPYAESFRLEQVHYLRQFLTSIDCKYPPACKQKKTPK